MSGVTRVKYHHTPTHTHTLTLRQQLSLSGWQVGGCMYIWTCGMSFAVCVCVQSLSRAEASQPIDLTSGSLAPLRIAIMRQCAAPDTQCSNDLTHATSVSLSVCAQPLGKYLALSQVLRHSVALCPAICTLSLSMKAPYDIFLP